jgi:WD40 repeat protein
MKGYPEKVSNIDWNRNSSYLASAGGNAAVVWKNTGKGPAGTMPKILKGHVQRITQLTFQHKGSCLASGAEDGDILIWRLKEGLEPVDKWHMISEITRLAWSPDDQFLVAGNKEGQVQHYSVAPATQC